MDPSLISRLRIHDACIGLSDDDIAKIAERVEIVNGKTGDVIFAGGQKLESFYLVASGRLRLSIVSPGGQQQTVRYVSAGDQFGALLLVTEDDDIPIRVEVDERAVLIRISKADFVAMADEFPRLRLNLLKKIGCGIRDSIITKRKRSFAKIVAFIHADDRTREVVAKIARRLAGMGEQIGILCDGTSLPYDPKIPYQSLRKDNGDYVDENDVRATIRNWPSLRRIFLVVDRVHPFEKLTRLVETCDSMFCMVKSDDMDPALNELRRLFKRVPSWSKKSHVIWVLREDEQVCPFVPGLDKLAERDFKVTYSPDAKHRLLHQGVERIVHYLRGVNIGVALSGGAARGMAHLGVLKALEEIDVTIDSMAGTSAGVLTGLIYCAGISPDVAIQSFTKELKPGSLYKALPKGDEIYMVAQFRARTWDAMLRKYVHDWRLEQLPVPLQTVTTDLISASSIVRKSGDGVQALLESINLPVIATPICRDGMMLVDGGVLNNLPTDILAQDGCNFVMGVDVSAHIEHQVGNNTADMPAEKMKPPGAIGNLLRCLNVQAHHSSGNGINNADVIIAPDVSMFDSAEFTRTPEIAEIGYQATMESVSAINEFLSNLDPQLFSDR
jgi:NTE family protein